MSNSLDKQDDQSVSYYNKQAPGSRSPKMREAPDPGVFSCRQQLRVAILVDGAFYLKQAKMLFGKKSPSDRASELITYCWRHIETDYLYRIFFYDCPPSEKQVFHPLTQKSVDLGKTELFKWANEFHGCLTRKRKLALRMGELLESQGEYSLDGTALKRLCKKQITVEDLKPKDFSLKIQQKGVDMRMGLDVASLAHKGLVDRIVMIAGDSDFVPAAKHARREGIDFVLDPMWHGITPSLMKHIDGLHSCVVRPPNNTNDPLHCDSQRKSEEME